MTGQGWDMIAFEQEHVLFYTGQYEGLVQKMTFPFEQVGYSHVSSGLTLRICKSEWHSPRSSALAMLLLIEVLPTLHNEPRFALPFNALRWFMVKFFTSLTSLDEYTSDLVSSHLSLM